MQAYLSEDQLSQLPLQIQSHFQRLEADIIARICQRLKRIGKLSVSDTYRLDELRRIGFDLDAIRGEVAETLAVAERDVYKAFRQASELEYMGQKTNFDLNNVYYTPYADSPQLQTLVESISRATAGKFSNYSGTTGFVNVRNNVGVLVQGHWQPLAEYYQNVVDYAVLQIRTGQTDFNSALRSSIRAMADHGFSCVEYDNEGKRRYIRRLDTSIRSAIMGGQAELSWAQAEFVSEQFGATGYEVSWHAAPRPSHRWIGGIQISRSRFYSEVLPLLREANCYHRAWGIIVGVSPSAHTAAEIDALNAKDAERHTYKGKEYDAREAQDRQREIETRIRQYKDRALAAKAIGDDKERIAARAQVANWQAEYYQFSEAMGLNPKRDRTRVASYR